MQVGFRIHAQAARISSVPAEAFTGIPTANIGDVMGRFYVMDPGIRPLHGQMSFCGHAVTVTCRPGDNLMLHKAIGLAQPGDILVVNTTGNTTNAVFGELMCRGAMAAKLGGIVVDGAVRDMLAITKLQFPTFSRSVCAGGCDKDGPGEINYPIACGGVVVRSGDIVVGDADGVVVIRQEDAAEVLENVKKHMEKEKKRVREIADGVIVKREIDEILAAKGVL
jgi:4-hydroxy-4-methyl-2-oxoglutarate aldolase